MKNEIIVSIDSASQNKIYFIIFKEMLKLYAHISAKGFIKQIIDSCKNTNMNVNKYQYNVSP